MTSQVVPHLPWGDLSESPEKPTKPIKASAHCSTSPLTSTWSNSAFIETVRAVREMFGSGDLDPDTEALLRARFATYIREHQGG